MRANHKDYAEFALLGLRFKLVSPASIITWADGLIADGDVPPSWLIDLALAKADAVDDALKRVPGESQADLSLRLFLALLGRRWRSGRLNIGEVRGIGWLLHCESALPSPDGQADWGVCLEVECEELDEGWRSEGEIRLSIDDYLADYHDFEPMIPAWA